jgi:hypothetical protein
MLSKVLANSSDSHFFLLEPIKSSSPQRHRDTETQRHRDTELKNKEKVSLTSFTKWVNDVYSVIHGFLCVLRVSVVNELRFLG